MAKGRKTTEEQERLKEHAKLLYTRENITNITELSARTGVSEKTLRTWIEDGGWKKLSRNFLLTREEQMANLLDELSEINETIRNKEAGQRYADTKTAQIRRQLIKDIKDLETKAMLPEIVEALQQFINAIRRENLADAQFVGKYADAFIKSKLRG